MAMKIETRELQPILAETQSAEGYALGLNGILKGYANEMKISYLNTTGSATVKIDSGILLWQGKRIYADNEGISFEISNETTSNTKYDIYLKIDMGQPDNVVAVYSKTGTYPNGYVTDDLFNNFRNGVNFVKIGECTNTNTGIIQVVKTVGYAERSLTPYLLWEGSCAIGDRFKLNGSIRDYPLLMIQLQNSSNNVLMAPSPPLFSGASNIRAMGMWTSATLQETVCALIDIYSDTELGLAQLTLLNHNSSGNHNAIRNNGIQRLIGFK